MVILCTPLSIVPTRVALSTKKIGKGQVADDAELLVFKEFHCSEHSGTVQWENKIYLRAMELRETTVC